MMSNHMDNKEVSEVVKHVSNAHDREGNKNGFKRDLKLWVCWDTEEDSENTNEDTVVF